MKKKDLFLLCVFSGAVAADLQNDTTNAQLIARIAAEIPEHQIPTCPMNAAKVFLSYYLGTRTEAFRWMGTAS